MLAPVQALIVVDLQAAFVTGGNAVPAARPLLAAVTTLLDRARQAGSLVVHLQNDGGPREADEPGRPGWALHLVTRPGEPVIQKTRDDGFHGTSLGPVLIQHRVNRLAVTGVQSEMCVSATARTALERGFGVVLPHDAHATYDIPASPELGPGVPAPVVSRVAEWSLGDQIELPARAADVPFEPAGR